MSFLLFVGSGLITVKAGRGGLGGGTAVAAVFTLNVRGFDDCLRPDFFFPPPALPEPPPPFEDDP